MATQRSIVLLADRVKHGKQVGHLMMWEGVWRRGRKRNRPEEGYSPGRQIGTIPIKTKFHLDVNRSIRLTE